MAPIRVTARAGAGRLSYVVRFSAHYGPLYDSLGNFEPVATLAQISEVLIVNPTLGAKTLEDFVRLAKASPRHNRKVP